MESSSGNRLTAISPDNHQPWLWFMHFFSITMVLAAAGMRIWMKYRQAALSDGLLLIAHILYVSHWLVLLFALINCLGKSEAITDALTKAKAAKLVFASQILFVVILSASILSTTFLIREIFTKDATRWWFRVIALIALAQAMVGSLLLSVGCSPSHKLDGKGNEHCPGRDVRWIVFTVLEAVLECILVIPVIIIVSKLQTSLQKKLWAISAFLCRLMVWIPLWLHLDFYLHFIRSGRPNIDIVPSMIMEELWIALALISASTPILMRVAKRFTTSGMQLSSAVGYGSSDSQGRTRKSGFRPDDGITTSQVDAHMMKERDEGKSIGSTAESQVGILRQVDFQVSTETK